jgi:hypothetical protein
MDLNTSEMRKEEMSPAVELLVFAIGLPAGSIVLAHGSGGAKR